MELEWETDRQMLMLDCQQIVWVYKLCFFATYKLWSSGPEESVYIKIKGRDVASFDEFGVGNNPASNRPECNNATNGLKNYH